MLSLVAPGQMPSELKHSGKRIANLFLSRDMKGMRRLRAKRRSKLIRTFVSDVHSETSWRRVEGLCAEMLRHFKGIRGFAKAWKVEIERASQVPPGAPRLLNSFVAIINLMGMVEQNRLTTPLQQAADEDLAARMQGALLELVRERPEVVLLAAEKLGWEVRAPEVASERWCKVQPGFLHF